MNLETLIAVIGCTLAIIASMLGLFLWIRTEANSDRRHMDSKLESNRDLVRAIHDEIKDFHFRLVEIENKRK